MSNKFIIWELNKILSTHKNLIMFLCSIAAPNKKQLQNGIKKFT